MQHSRSMSFFTGVGLSAAIAFPVSAASLVIYSPQGEANLQWVTEQAKATGLDVKFLRAGGGEIYDRLMAEKNNPQADIVLGMVDTSMELLKSEGLFQAYSPVWAGGLSEQYKDAGSYIHKFWKTPIVIAYNPDKLPIAQAPTSWLDLVKPEYKGKYVIGNISWQTTRVYLAGMLARFLDEKGEVTDAGWSFMNTLYANGIVVNDPEAQMEAFKSGGATINLNWYGGVVTMASDLGVPMKVVDTEGGTPVISEGLAIIAGTKRLDDAKAFVDWFGSADVMAAYAAKFGTIPTLPEALSKAPAEVQRNSNIVKMQPIDWNVIAPKLDGWLQRIELDIR